MGKVVDKQDARDALAILSTKRDQFDVDRAFRLLASVMANTPVEPIPLERRGLFSLEEKLGRMPLDEAFAFLAERQPMLHQFIPNARASDAAIATSVNEEIKNTHKDDMPTRVSAAVGPAAQHCSDPLLRSQLALSLASHYLALLAGAQDGDISCSYFSSRKKRVTLSGGFSMR
jgi:hypothetical protein